MASTVTPTSFYVKIIEEQVVRNSVIKHEVTHIFNDITNVDHRILTCPNTTSIDLFNVNGINPGAGTFPSSSLKYARITNLDDTYYIAITYSGSQGQITQNLPPTNSLFIANSSITSSNFNGTFGDNIESVKAYAISGSIDIEYTLINS
tara:strand:- start:484 stop:930 length:447 start_codon:yes stop_codon:yes gene_type:complete